MLSLNFHYLILAGDIGDKYGMFWSS